MRRGDRLDELFTLIFMLLAIAAIVCYFAFGGSMAYFYLGCCAVVLRTVQYFMRMFGK